MDDMTTQDLLRMQIGLLQRLVYAMEDLATKKKVQRTNAARARNGKAAAQVRRELEEFRARQPLDVPRDSPEG